jgi:hypothetical protein
MKKIVQLLTIVCTIQCVEAQVSAVTTKAGFGLDGDLRCNFYNNFAQSGTDDWFYYPGSNKHVIDTTGAAAILARYIVDNNFRKLPFFRTMSVAPYSDMSHRRAIDAVFIRDYHGSDSTIFASGSNKNGMTPADWTCPVAQGIPDKNDILDMFVHVRRQGLNTTDSLWMFGGLSIENTTGNRYFDFEMYQTDIYYDRPSRRFYGYGNEAGHTAWNFNAAGEVTKPGDIIFTAEYSSSALTVIEARIWVDRSALLTIPEGFDWTQSFDGATNGAQYGYAGIVPKTTGAFYFGLTNSSSVSAGPFGLIREDNSLVTNYVAGQFMEFGVNLTKLGLDPVTLLGGNACGMPFRRILVKSRASTSFTAELKDFVGPFDFFLAPRADVAADVSVFCGVSGVSQIQVVNAVPTSTYNWTTPDGHITTPTTGTSITVDHPGTYIVTQQLQSGCSTYATDTIAITFDASCSILGKNLADFRAVLRDREAQLSWKVYDNEEIKYFTVERSLDGVHFTPVTSPVNARSQTGSAGYTMSDVLGNIKTSGVFYRLKITGVNGTATYSKIIRLSLKENGKASINITPNPVKENVQINVSSLNDNKMDVFIYDITGKSMKTLHTMIQKGNSAISIPDVQGWPRGTYVVKAVLGNEVFVERMVLTK